MRLYNMKNIRRRKRISREKIAKDLNLTPAYIKHLETEEIMEIDNELLDKIACYLKVDVDELSAAIVLNVKYNKILENREVYINDEFITSVNHELDRNEVEAIINKIKINYDLTTATGIKSFISEFKYRILELEDKHEQENKSFIDSLFNEDNIDDEETDSSDLNEVAIDRKSVV